jgi:hypothetical protein
MGVSPGRWDQPRPTGGSRTYVPTRRLVAWPHGPCHKTRGYHMRGATPEEKHGTRARPYGHFTYDQGPRPGGQAWAPSPMGFNFIIVILLMIFQQIWRFLALFGGYWALFEARSWGEVGRWLPTSDLYKPGLLEAMRGDSEQVYAEYFPSQSHFYAGKLLRSTPLRAISGSSGHPI